jgi:hypothetical protein
MLMLTKDDPRLRDLVYLIEFGEFDLARTKLAVLQAASPGDPLLVPLITQLASAPEGSVDSYAHLSSNINYADDGNNSGITITPEEAKQWPGYCVGLSGFAMFIAAIKCSVWTLIPALQQGWDTPITMVLTRRGVPRGVFHLTVGQYVIENAFLLGVGPLLLIIGVLGLLFKAFTALKRTEQ